MTNKDRLELLLWRQKNKLSVANPDDYAVYSVINPCLEALMGAANDWSDFVANLVKLVEGKWE